VTHHDTNLKGNVAEMEIALAAMRLGIDVLRPMGEHTRYDLMFDLGPRLLRVQCKWGGFKRGAVVVNLQGYRYTHRGPVISVYTVDEIDAVAVYCGEIDRCYLLPAHLVAGRRGIQLRVEPPKNAQRAALNWASQFELEGAIAQSGERLRGTQEVAGSSPASSISTASSPTTVGSNQFRNHFGWYLERAAAGEEFEVTRRGRPYARLVPVQPRLATAPPEQPELASVAPVPPVPPVPPEAAPDPEPAEVPPEPAPVTRSPPRLEVV
jgi:prevent-host-death family protein